jgi:hypothetical protein
LIGDDEASLQQPQAQREDNWEKEKEQLIVEGID